MPEEHPSTVCSTTVDISFDNHVYISQAYRGLKWEVQEAVEVRSLYLEYQWVASFLESVKKESRESKAFSTIRMSAFQATYLRSGPNGVERISMVLVPIDVCGLEYEPS